MLKEGFTDDEKKAAEEKFNHRSADVARCWIKYALNLMTDSKDRLMDDRDILGECYSLKSKEIFTVILMSFNRHTDSNATEIRFTNRRCLRRSYNRSILARHGRCKASVFDASEMD